MRSLRSITPLSNASTAQPGRSGRMCRLRILLRASAFSARMLADTFRDVCYLIFFAGEMEKPALEILIIFLLLVLNGIFAMSEIAIVSARKARLQQLAEEGNLKARAALELANRPNDFLSTVQIGITLVGILAGAFGGATLAQELA